MFSENRNKAKQSKAKICSEKHKNCVEIFLRTAYRRCRRRSHLLKLPNNTLENEEEEKRKKKRGKKEKK